LNVNQTIPENNNAITISDNFKYNVSGFTFGSTKTTLKTIQEINNKKLKFTGSCNGLTVKDAGFTTRRITIDIPRKTSAIVVDKLISTR
jgi:hypothetical protein